MSDLQNRTPANTYKGLLQVGDYTNGVDPTSKYVSDGEGTNSALSLSTTKVGIGTDNPSQELEVNGDIVATTLTTSGVATVGSVSTSGAVTASGAVTGGSVTASGAVTGGSVSTNGAVTAGSIDVSGNVIADEYALDGTGSSTSALAIHAPIPNELAIRTNSNERVRIDSSGKVGIATDPSTANLEVKGTEAFRCIGTDGNDKLRVYTADNGAVLGIGSDVSSTDLIRLDARPSSPNHSWFNSGNLGIGTETFGTDSGNQQTKYVLGMKVVGNPPATSPADIIQLYAEDVSSSAELRVRDELGNVKTLSPHAKDAPTSLYDRPPGVEEMHRSANHYLGTIIFTNVDRRNTLMQKQLNGEELPEDRTFTVTETFAEYNARTGADLQVEDWDANQQAMVDADESYIKKPKPEWLS